MKADIEVQGWRREKGTRKERRERYKIKGKERGERKRKEGRKVEREHTRPSIQSDPLGFDFLQRVCFFLSVALLSSSISGSLAGDLFLGSLLLDDLLQTAKRI